MNEPTLLWHDYETWGATPAVDKPAQFAAIRTDLDLNPIGEPIELFCRLPVDYLPSPEAMFITGLTPQKVNRLGMVEAEFMAQVNAEMAKPNTCTVGYNSLRFDDEVTRYALYRNFIDPYAREWQHGNSRWDLIDLVRACYALRPEGINWPEREDGVPSFKLEHLTAANGLGHDSAHDAVSDVHATIALARLIKEKQPKLYQWHFSLRKKAAVSHHIDILNLKPLLHISSRFPAKQGCASLLLPMAWHPTNKNAVICVDLQHDPSPLFELSAEALNQRLYQKAAERDATALRVPIKLIHLNKSPFIAPANTLDDANAERLGLDKASCRRHFQLLRQQQVPVRAILQALFELPAPSREQPVDQQLYGAFFSTADRAQIELVHACDPVNLAALNPSFTDPRLPELLFLYKARNYPHSLSEAEQRRWQQHCMNRLDQPEYIYHLERLAEENAQDEQKTRQLTALGHYLQSL